MVSTYDMVVNIGELEVTVTGTFFVELDIGRLVTLVVVLVTVEFETGLLLTGLDDDAGFWVVLFDTFTGFDVVLLGGIEEVGFCVEFDVLLLTFETGLLVILLVLVVIGLDGAFVVCFCVTTLLVVKGRLVVVNTLGLTKSVVSGITVDSDLFADS